MDIDLTVGTYIVDDGEVLLIHHRKLDKWLPVGGHIDPNETPDQAVKREAMEETGLEIELFSDDELVEDGDIREILARPFHVNRHNVGDHDHVCFYYVSEPETREVEVNEREIKDFRWFTEEEIRSEELQGDVREQALKALEIYSRER